MKKIIPAESFVIGALNNFDLKANGPARPFADWQYPVLARVAGTRLGELDITHFYPPVLTFDNDCNVQDQFSSNLQKTLLLRNWLTPFCIWDLEIWG